MAGEAVLVKGRQCGRCRRPERRFKPSPKRPDGLSATCTECAEEARTKQTARRAADPEKNRAIQLRYVRRHRSEVLDQQRRYRALKVVSELRRIAKQAVKSEVRAGRLHAQPCEECGSRSHLEAHHDDYAQPLAIRWLCRAHHAQWHRKNGPGKNA